MKWNRSETIALALNSCTRCEGLGLCLAGEDLAPCDCVLRAIFRACYAHFRRCATKEKHISSGSLDAVPGGREGSYTWGLKDEEYMADFVLVSRRTLPGGEYAVFKYHFLLGADPKLCCRRLNLSRSGFFRAVHRIEQTLGRVFRELEPYSLFPIDEYYNGPRREHAAKPASEPHPPPRMETRRIDMRMFLRSA